MMGLPPPSYSSLARVPPPFYEREKGEKRGEMAQVAVRSLSLVSPFSVSVYRLGGGERGERERGGGGERAVDSSHLHSSPSRTSSVGKRGGREGRKGGGKGRRWRIDQSRHVL